MSFLGVLSLHGGELHHDTETSLPLIYRLDFDEPCLLSSAEYILADIGPHDYG